MRNIYEGVMHRIWHGPLPPLRGVRPDWVVLFGAATGKCPFVLPREDHEEVAVELWDYDSGRHSVF